MLVLSATARLNESLYSIKSVGESGLPLGEVNRLVGLTGSEKSCLPAIAFGDETSSNAAGQPQLPLSIKELRAGVSVFSNDCIFIDSGVSCELKKKVEFDLYEVLLYSYLIVVDHVAIFIFHSF